MINDKYHNINNFNEVKSIDDLLDQYENDKATVIKLIEENTTELLNTIYTFLSIDNTCRKNLNKNNQYADFSCTRCEELSHIFDFDTYELNEPYIIQSGKLQGLSLIVIENKIDELSLKWTNNKIKGDNFTIKILITWYIEHLFKCNNIPHALNLYTGFICNNKGYLLYKIPIINNEICNFDCIIEQKCNINIVYGILLQILVIFNELNKINFSYGNPVCSSLLFEEVPCDYNYIYDNINYNIKSEYTVKISSLDKSSITVNNIDIFPVCHQINSIINNNFMVKCTDTTNECMFKINPRFLNSTFNHLKYTSPKSIDFYLLIISMMFNEDFFNIVINNEKCYGIWKCIWNDQHKIVENKIKNNMTDNNIFNVLKDIEMFIDPYKNIFNEIKTNPF